MARHWQPTSPPIRIPPRRGPPRRRARAPGRGRRGGRPGKGRGRRQGALLRLRAEIPLSARWCSRSPVSRACWPCGGLRRRSGRPTPSSSRARRPPGTRGVDYWNSGELCTDFTRRARRASSRPTRSAWASASCSASRSGASDRSSRSSSRPSGSCATSRPPRSRRCSCSGSASTRPPKVALIIVGTVFYNILMIADVARGVPRELIAHLVHARRGPRDVLRRVVLPHSWPGIIDVARINLAAAWLDARRRRAARRAGRPRLPAGPVAARSARSTACSRSSSSSASSASSATSRSRGSPQPHGPLGAAMTA